MTHLEQKVFETFEGGAHSFAGYSTLLAGASAAPASSSVFLK